VSAEAAALHSPRKLVSFLDAVPFAAALLTVRDDSRGGAGRPFDVVHCNKAWRAFWRYGGAPDSAADNQPGELIERFVDIAQARELSRCIVAGLPFDSLAPCDLDGPRLLHVHGFRLGTFYVLMLELVANPEQLEACWPAQPGLEARACEFGYMAGLAPDGRWRVTASSPDFRAVLQVGDTVDGWLDWAIPADRPALRSRNLQLLSGASRSDSYTLALPGERRVRLADSVVPVRHPATQEVIGLLGRVRVLPKTDESRESRSSAAAAPATRPAGPVACDWQPIVRILDSMQIAALLVAPDGRIAVGSAAAADLLGEPVEQLIGGSAIELLFSDEDSGMTALAAALSKSSASDDAVFEPDVGDTPGQPAGALMSMTLQPILIGSDPYVMVRLTADPPIESRLRDVHYFDSSTGLPNRFLCLDRLRQNIGRCAVAETMLAVLVLEIDHRALADRSLGRSMEEGVLAAIARRLVGAIGGLDTAARLTESRFAVIVSGVAGPDDAARTAQALLDQLREPVAVAGHELGVVAKIGIAVFPDDGDDADALLAHAEVALDRQADAFGAGYRFFTSAMNAASSNRLLLEQQLLDAVERNEFLLLYQPQISFASSRIVGMEALIRWRHPELGMVPPAEFIPLAEETGAIIAIGEWVLETACRELQRWFEVGVAPLRLAINISGRQYNDPSLVEGIGRTLRAIGFPAHLLELELTESVIMEDVVDAARRLGALHELGVNLAVDDFGTGYSSLSYLKRFPIRSLKVDRSFVRDIAHNESSAAIARALIAFGSALGLKIIAEGVESHDQYDILRGCGCDELQGYLFSRPVPAEDARKLATERRHLPMVRS